MATTAETEGIPTVLLIDEYPEDRQIIKHMLIGRGYRIQTVPPDGDVRDALRDSLPDAVVLATDAAGESISETCRHIKAVDENDEIPIVIVSEQADLMAFTSGMPGVFDYVGNPGSRDEILARLRNVLRLGELKAQLEAARRQLVEAQKMECVGVLAAGVAHEFNNLMCSVMGFAEMARSGGGTDIEALQESAEVSYQAAKRAATTASSLLAFSRRAKSGNALGDVNEAVMAAVRLLKRNIEKSGVKLEFEPGELPQTRFAFGPMQQVFLNLIINAWHATVDREGKREITLSSFCEDDVRIGITVEDTGTGISRENLENIFEPFFTTKHRGDDSSIEGSGLGLMIVREVTREHDGVVTVESEEGKGTLFTVLIPVRQDDRDGGADAGETVGVEQVPGRTVSVLVVDDEEPTRKIIGRMLTKRGHRAFLAANMSEAVGLLWSNEIDLITMDLVMPDSSGVTNVQRLREEGVEIPILICTGNADDISADKALTAGANAVLRKPFSVAEFLGEMEACLGDARSRDR